MTYTITEVAKLAYISTRTLRYYDEIGLLKSIPSRQKGVRKYNKNHLVTLQAILLYREMGMPLEEIKRILHATQFQQVKSLESHRLQLKYQLSRTRQLIETVEKTMKHLVDDLPMGEMELFMGLQHPDQEDVKAELRDNLGELGEKIIDQSEHIATNLSKEELRESIDESTVAFDDFLILIERGLGAESPEAQNWVDRYVQRVRDMMPELSDQGIMKLVELETLNPKLKQRMDKMHPALAAYFLTAVTHYFKM